MSHFAIYGHRGSPRAFPENTSASFEETLRAGADGFETDLRMLSDGTAVLFHDDDFREEPIESLSAATFRERGGIITAVSELSAFAGRTTMILEIKRSGWEEELIERIASWKPIIVASFDHRLIEALSRRRPPFPLGLTIFGVIAGLPRYARELGATWIFPAHRYVDAHFVEPLHAAGLTVVPWTANTPRDWQRIRAAGCDGVITDFAREAVEWRGKNQDGGRS